jgi:NAD(P)-dependent dehydrogenase (short-subunit alcohol dehydrogenase family)
MPEMKVVAVVGATGTQGGALVRAIASDPDGGFVARAITRDPNAEKAQALKGLVAEVVQADLDDEASLERAFPQAVDELGNMFQFKRDFEADYVGARDIDVTRSLNPELQDFDTWLAANKDKIPVE